MLVMMQAHATEEEIRAVCRKIEELGFRAHPIPGATRTAIGITGNTGPGDASALEAPAGAREGLRRPRPYSLAGREIKESDAVVDLGDGVCIGGAELAIIAGPCAI